MIISDEHRSVFTEFFISVYGDQCAVNLSMMLIEVCHVWDDLIDKDNEVTDDEINLVFRYLIYDIPKNRIYQAIPSLPDHLLAIYLQWRDATTIESSDNTDDDLNKCYMLRAGVYNIFAVIAYYLRGDEAMKEIGPAIRRLYGETLNDYKEEFKNA